MTTTVALAGASGRMGRLAETVIERMHGVEITARLGSADAPDAMLGADLLLDFTLPHISPELVEFALQHELNVVVGTSGWSADRLGKLERTLSGLPERGAIVIPNFSVGSVLATSFAAQAARFFDSAEIIEAHHAGKVDSPSGTAVRTAELMAEARAELGPVSAPHSDQRARGQLVGGIPVHSQRLTGVVAEQQVVLGGTGELLRISHQTISPSSYEAGIRLAIERAPESTGLTVGLDRLLGL